MIINRVVFASNSNKNYIEFWPLVAKAWSSLGVKPTLIYTDEDDSCVDKECGDVIYIPKIDGLDSAFVAQNSRLLCPALFPEEVCIISDIDNMPLSKEYYFKPIKDLNDDKFVIYRPHVCDDDQISIMWNAALGKTWGDIFNISDFNDVISTLKSWYPKEYKAFSGFGSVHDTWFTDQLLLYKYVESFRENNSEKIVELDDDTSGFYRLDRLCNDSKCSTVYNSEANYSDFHMPRPYSQYKKQIDEIYEFYYGNNRDSQTK